MNLLQSEKTYDELLLLMDTYGYSAQHIKRVKREIKWLAANQDDHNISSYEEAYRIRSELTGSESMKEQYRAVYNLLKRYCTHGDLLAQMREPLFRKDTYSQLNPYFRSLLDAYEESSKSRGLKSGTYRSAMSACSGLLLFIQENGHETLEKVSEKDVLSYFTANNRREPLSSSTKVNIASVFRADISTYTEDARRILSYLPALRRNRKTIQYLTEEEICSVRDILSSEDSRLSMRDRAIGMLLYFTGMRASDVSALRFSDIDWVDDEIRITQRKTGNELLLPLTAPVGNALYDYISAERPESRHNQVFLCEQAPYQPISPGTVGNAADKIYDAASIRQNPHDRRGSHIFRHNLAASFAGNGIPRPVISATLGHSDPDSLDHYLFADIRHLRECSLSIEDFPVRKGVFEG